MVNKYQKHKEKLQKEAPERYQHFSEKKKKDKKHQLAPEQYTNFSE